ncbi:MAG TPA: hypothetical protein VFL94_12560 [Actinomycetales bacterium]|nr:hypothetical protein [Actinomycetales bacterium]
MTSLASNDVNTAQTLARRMPRVTAATLERDRHLADTLPGLEARLVTARGRLAAAYRTPVGADETQRRFIAVTRAYDALVLGYEAAYRVAVGPTVKRALFRITNGRQSPQAKATLLRLDAVRTARQQHLLHASDAVRVPGSVQTSSRAAYGPHGAGMHFDPKPPLGPLPTRTYGVNLNGLLDREAEDAAQQVQQAAASEAARAGRAPQTVSS